METSELIKKVRKIEIKTRGITKQMFSGEYHSAFKGRGMAFSEVREYFPGDDIRSIDWNVTARYASPFVKVFEEERELTVLLLVDISGSQNFGTRLQFKKDIVTELSAVLAFSAIQNNDKIGVILFSDIIEKFIPPKKGKYHALRIIRELIEFKPKRKKTDINSALRYLTNVIKKRAIVFVISDFLTSNYESGLRIAAKKHDTIAVQIYDTFEQELPKVGMIRVFDAESGNYDWVDTSSKKLRSNYKDWWDSNQKNLSIILNRNKVDLIKIRTDESYISPLQNFFKKREHKR
ncbi:MAG: DUF58 domain-containing protein [Candidatus Kapaibacterium sp.]|jgi:uncharacterized protein (DUF58 family)|nr:DUF58 domain-containing protein [Candidatus Kapabacteria bacterium]